MDTEKWLDTYTKWLRNQYKVSALPDGDEISTPFTNNIGDNVRIYVQEIDQGKLALTDDGNTFNDLTMMGIDVTNKTLQDLIANILNQYSVSLDDNNVLTIKGKYNQFSVMKQNLIQTILRIGDLVQTRKGIISNLFKQEVSDFLYESDIGALPSYSVQGSTGNNYTIDFAIANSKSHPLQLIQAINRPTFERIAVESITYDDIKTSPFFDNKPVQYFVIYNDQDNALPEKAQKIAIMHGTKLVPWSEKVELRHSLS